MVVEQFQRGKHTLPSIASAAASGQDERLVIGVVGGGGAARRLVSALEANRSTRVVAVVCGDTELRDLPSDFARLATIDELLDRSDVQAVFIATPVHVHVQHARTALRADKHVLIEKPLGLSVSDLASLETVIQKRLIVGTAFKKRFGQGIALAKQLPWSIGSRTVAHYSWHVPAPDLSDWRHRPELSGGGVVMDLGSHVIDLLEYLLGPIGRVDASTARALGGQVETYAAIRLEFRCGARATADLSWHGDAPSYRFSIQDKDELFQQSTHTQLEDLGEVSGSAGRHRFILNRNAEYVGLIGAFADAVGGITACLPSVNDGRRNLHMIQKIYESAKHGTPIDV